MSAGPEAAPRRNERPAFALLGDEGLRLCLRRMHLVRRFEEAAEQSYIRGLIHGTMHLSIGQEASAVGAVAALRPDDYILSQEAKLDVYRRLTNMRDVAAIEGLRTEVRDRFGALPGPADALFGSAMLRVIGAELGVEGVLVRASEARITFRADAVPRLKGLSAAFHGVQFQVDVRRAQPLALKLTRLGGAEMLEGLIRALKALVP